MKPLIMASLALVCLGLVGCSNDPFNIALQAHNDGASLIKNSMNSVDGLRGVGVITTAEETKVLSYLEFANKQNASFLVCATNAHVAGNVPGTYTACAQTVLTNLQSPGELALLQVSNTTGITDVEAIAQGVIEGANAVITALKGA